jgi:hypothetical protein
MNVGDSMNVGDLVKLKTHDRFIGIVLERHPKAISTTPAQIRIKWLNGDGSIAWEPEGWVKVVSDASRCS